MAKDRTFGHACFVPRTTTVPFLVCQDESVVKTCSTAVFVVPINSHFNVRAQIRFVCSMFFFRTQVQSGASESNEAKKGEVWPSQRCRRGGCVLESAGLDKLDEGGRGEGLFRRNWFPLRIEHFSLVAPTPGSISGCAESIHKWSRYGMEPETVKTLTISMQVVIPAPLDVFDLPKDLRFFGEDV